MNMNGILRTSLWEQRRLVSVVAVYTLSAVAIAVYLGEIDRLLSSFYLTLYPFLLGLYLGALGLLRLIYIMAWIRPHRLTLHLLGELRDWLTLERILRAGPVLLLIPLFIGSFTFLKSMIPALQSFRWDPIFLSWDLMLHRGLHPWQWLQPVLGHPWLTSTINFFYHAWVFVIYAALYWQTFNLTRPRIRMQFLLSFTLSWMLIGTLMAIILSSAGPVYYADIYHPETDPYAPLLEYLRSANEQYPVWSLNVHSMLWECYTTNSNGLGCGISAMPSMHVASSFLVALLGWSWNRLLGAVLGLYTLIILIGSVHLGWHYAIDGYLACVLAGVLWWAVGKWLSNDDQDSTDTCTIGVLPCPAATEIKNE